MSCIRAAALRTALGHTPSEAFLAWQRGARAHAPIARFDARTYPCARGAEIREAPPQRRDLRHLKRMGVYAWDAGREALAAAGDIARGERLGLYAAYGGLRAHWEDLMPAMSAQTGAHESPWQKGLSGFHPFWMLKHLSNNSHALLAEAIDARGDGATYGGANAGAQAIEAACAALAARVIDTALVVAFDSLLEPETLIDLGTQGALAASEACRPAYDTGACGYVPGEAAAALVLCRPEGSEQGPRLSAWSTADGERGEPDASLLASFAEPLAGARAVDGASRARRALDDAERSALASGHLTSLQASFGQLGGATAVVQAILLSEALRHGSLPPIAGLEQPAPGPCDPLTKPLALDPDAVLGGISTGAPGLAGLVRVSAR